MWYRIKQIWNDGIDITKLVDESVLGVVAILLIGAVVGFVIIMPMAEFFNGN